MALSPSFWGDQPHDFPGHVLGQNLTCWVMLDGSQGGGDVGGPPAFCPRSPWSASPTPSSGFCLVSSAPVGPPTRPVSAPPRGEAERRLGCPQTALEASGVPVDHMGTFEVSFYSILLEKMCPHGSGDPTWW